MSNLDLPSTFKEEQKKQLKNRIEELKNKLIQWEKDNDATIVPVLSSDISSIHADIKVIPNDMIKGN